MDLDGFYPVGGDKVNDNPKSSRLTLAGRDTSSASCFDPSVIRVPAGAHLRSPGDQEGPEARTTAVTPVDAPPGARNEPTVTMIISCQQMAAASEM